MTVPIGIEKILRALKDKKTISEDDQVKLDTFLSGLETAIVNPVQKSRILVNPIPNEPDVSIRTERTLEERIRHINSVSARVRAQMQPQDPSELNFDDIDDSGDMLPKSIFEVADHEHFQEEVVLNAEDLPLDEPNPDLDVPVEESQPPSDAT